MLQSYRWITTANGGKHIKPTYAVQSGIQSRPDGNSRKNTLALIVFRCVPCVRGYSARFKSLESVCRSPTGSDLSCCSERGQRDQAQRVRDSECLHPLNRAPKKERKKGKDP